MERTLARHPHVPFRRLALSEERAAAQIKKGLFTMERGEPFALPMDKVADPTTYLDRTLWRQTGDGRVYRPGVKFKTFQTARHRQVLSWLRDNVHPNIPQLYYTAVLGHDIHVTMYAELAGAHWHRGWANPFTGETEGPIDPEYDTFFRTHWGEKAHELTYGVCKLDQKCPGKLWPNPDSLKALMDGFRGFTEDLGILGRAKVTDAFVSEEIDELVDGSGTEYDDFDFHEVGTSNTAEDNDDTALGTSSGISRATGSPTDSDPDYVNVGTITADASETWEEHGLFNNSSSAALMDRQLTGGQAVVSSDQVEYTVTETKNPEA